MRELLIPESGRIGLDRVVELANRHLRLDVVYIAELTGTRQDPCVLDTFISAVRFMEGAPARPWWSHTAERKKKFPTSSLAPRKVATARRRK